MWIKTKVWKKFWTELKFQKDIWMTLTKKVKSWGQGLEEDLDQV